MAKLLLIQSLFVEQFGIMTLSAVAKAKGHDVMLAIGSDDHVFNKAKKFKPDVVGFSVLTGYQKRYLELGNKLKQHLIPKPLILFGGPHATFFPGVIMEEGVDIVCRGEGEGALLDILDNVDTGNNLEGIGNLVLKSNGKPFFSPMRPLVDIDSTPFPDREIYKDYPLIHNSDMVTFMASRGCPFHCTFCFNKDMVDMVKGLGSWVRFRSVENLIEEIDVVSRHKKIRFIDFHDDTFIIKHRWLIDFLSAYADKFSMPFSCHIRGDLINIEIAKALKAAGCYRVSFGVECGNERLRNNVLKKNLTDNQILKAASVLKEVGIPFFTYNMMGLPGENLDDAFKTLELNVKIGTDCAWTSIFQPFPGTELAEYCLKKGFLEKRISTDEPVDTHTTSHLCQPDIDKIVRLQKFAYLAITFPGMLSLIKRVINYDLPVIYFYIHRISYLLIYFRKAYQTNFIGTIKHAWHAWRHYR